MMSKKFFFSIDKILDKDKIEIGGKARNVLKLAQIPEVKIPQSWILQAKAFEYFVWENFTSNEFNQMVKNYLKYSQKASLFAKLAHAPFPESLKEEIFTQIPQNDLVIIRSSGTCEDSSVTSLAGHYESIISRTNRKDLLFTIKSCWLVGLRVYLEHIHCKFASSNWPKVSKEVLNSIALLFQTIVKAEKSGIYFSQSPIHPEGEFVVANWGTCHPCVDGKMANDYYVLKQGNLKSQTIRYKFEMTSFSCSQHLFPGERINTPIGKTTVHFPYGNFIYSTRVPTPYDQISVLNKDDLKAIHKISGKIKEHMGYEIDMEWSFVGDQLVVLQVRPITTSPPESNLHSMDVEYVIASPGTAKGPVKIVLSPDDIYKVNEGDIIAVQATDPDYMSIIYKASGIVSEEGSPLCHTAIVARELKVPCILGFSKATSGAFIEGEIIIIDANKGRILHSNEDILLDSLESKKKFKRNKILYNVNHLGILDGGSTCKISASALLHGFFFYSGWADPTVGRVVKYVELIKRRYNISQVEIYWDLTDHQNVKAETDLNLIALKEAIDKGVF